MLRTKVLALTAGEDSQVFVQPPGSTESPLSGLLKMWVLAQENVALAEVIVEA